MLILLEWNLVNVAFTLLNSSTEFELEWLCFIENGSNYGSSSNKTGLSISKIYRHRLMKVRPRVKYGREPQLWPKDSGPILIITGELLNTVWLTIVIGWLREVSWRMLYSHCGVCRMLETVIMTQVSQEYLDYRLRCKKKSNIFLLSISVLKIILM